MVHVMTPELDTHDGNLSGELDYDSLLEPMKARIPFSLFFLCAFGQLATIVLVYRLLASRVLHTELGHPWLILLWTFLFGAQLSLFEYLYHRYLLHSAVLPFIGAMQSAHVTHHGLTNVQAPVHASQPDRLAEVKSEFPIEEKHQEESMMFPLYSGFIFVALFMLVLGIPLKLVIPGQPVLISLIFTVMLYYGGYEVWHAILHLPYERFWQPRMKKALFRRIYGFHLMHHWRPTSNMAIVGFWGVALWDHLFGTHRRPTRMPLNNAQVSYVDSKLRKPRWPISMFDRWQGGLARSSRRIERYLSSALLRRHHNPK